MDPFGQACLNYLKGSRGEVIEVESLECETHEMPVDYLFRTYEEMPKLEQKAMGLCKGRILDVGAGAGAHAYYLQEKGLDVTCLDISDGAIQCLKERGLKAIQQSVFEYESDKKFDTILLLMNGTGIAKSFDEFKSLIIHLKSLLTQEGKILIESTDLIYLFEDDPHFLDMANSTYYGLIHYRMHYNGFLSEWFPWLYLDEEKISVLVKQCNLSSKIIYLGNQMNFLVEIK